MVRVPMILYGYIQDHQLQSDEVTKRSDIYHCPMLLWHLWFLRHI